MLPLSVDEAAHDDGPVPKGVTGSGLVLTVHKDDPLLEEALPGSQQLDLADGVSARVTASEDGLDATRVEWASESHSYVLLGDRVVPPSGQETEPTREDAPVTAASTALVRTPDTRPPGRHRSRSRIACWRRPCG